MNQCMQVPQTAVWQPDPGNGLWSRTNSDVERMISADAWLKDARAGHGPISLADQVTTMTSQQYRYNRVMGSQGLHTLQLMLPNVPEEVVDHAVRIRREIDALDDVHDAEPVPFLEDWHSLELDCREYLIEGLCRDPTCSMKWIDEESTLSCPHFTTSVVFDQYSITRSSNT